MSEEIMTRLQNAIVALDANGVKAVARQSIEAGLDPLEVINQGIRPALDAVGDRFTAGDLFLPELMLSAKAADAAVQILEPELLKRGSSGDNLGKVLMTTVKGDIHDIGKNIVTLLLKAAGFEVVDIGVDKTGEEIFAAAEEHQVDLIGLSAILTTTMPKMREFIELIQEYGVREKYKVIVGGAPVTQEFANKIGAEGYGADASRAVNVAKDLVSS